MSDDLQDELIQFLVSASTVGRKQGAILAKFNGHSAEQIENELKALQAEQRVQKFIVKGARGSGRPYTVWRATTKIFDA